MKAFHGVCGVVERLEQTRRAIEQWKNDSNLKISVFANIYIRDLDEQIKQERQNADEEIELRKIQYGVED